MNSFIWALIASIVVSLISLIGIFSLLIKDEWLNKILILLVGFSAGSLIGGAFLHLLPEALAESQSSVIFIYVILGFLFFFILERYIHWRHCHKEDCQAHAFTYLNIIGDSIHNFTDGLVIGASFLVNVRFGVITTLMIIFHEIPQEIGDFGVLVYGGFSKAKALLYNLISALLCVLGTVMGYYWANSFGNFSSFIMPLVAGGFIYIAACDLIPELHKQTEFKKTSLSTLFFLLGILFIFLTKLMLPH